MTILGILIVALTAAVLFLINIALHYRQKAIAGERLYDKIFVEGSLPWLSHDQLTVQTTSNGRTYQRLWRVVEQDGMPFSVGMVKTKRVS